MSKTGALLLLGARLLRTASEKQPDKPGVVYFEIARNRTNEDGEVVRSIRRMKTTLTGTPENYVNINKDAIIELVRLAYCVLEQLTKRGGEVSVDDAMAEFRKAVGGDIAYKKSIRRAKEDFPLRADLVNVGDNLKRFFKFDYSYKEKDDTTLVGYMETTASQFKNDGKVAASRSYLSTKNSIAKFVGNSEVKLIEVNRRFIEEYAQWLTLKGVAESTQSFYLRTLRSALNHASQSKLISIPDNLFEGLNTKAQLPSQRKNGSGIDNEIIKKIATIDLSDNQEAELTRDMYMFSFYCHGMELVDVLNLKKSDIKNGTLIFQRRQKGTTRKVTLDQGAVDILCKYSSDTETYLFPLMEKYLRSQHYTVTDKVRNNIKLIGQQVGYPELTFSSNIPAWQKIMSQISLSNILFGHNL